MKLYYNPVSTYSQKVLLALYEKDIAFEPIVVNLMDPDKRAEYLEVYPLGKIPCLIADDERMIPESSIIVEYLETHFENGPKLIPDDPDLARQTRFMDRMNDLYLNESVTAILFDSWKPEDQRDPEAVEKARFRLGVMYGYIEKQLAEQDWLMGDFSLADCAMTPLLYAEQIAPFSEHTNIQAYWERLQARPSHQKMMQEVGPALAALQANQAA